MLGIYWIFFASFVLGSNWWNAITRERKWNSIWDSFTQQEFSSPQVLITMLHITIIAEPHQLWLPDKFCHLSFPLFCAYPNRHVFCAIVFCCLFYLHTYSVYTSLNILHSLLGEVSTHKCRFREGEAFSLYFLSHPLSCVLLGETVLHGEEGAMFAMTEWFDLLRNSSCTSGCRLFGREFHFVRQSVVVGYCSFLRPFLQSACTRWFERPESKAWVFQIWGALRFLNFSATNFLSVLTLMPALIIPLRVIIQLELSPSNVSSVLLRVYHCLLFTSANFLLTRQAELPTRVIQHFTFIWNPCLASKERVWRGAFWLQVTSPVDSPFCHLTPYRIAFGRAVCKNPNLLQLSERQALRSFLFCLLSSGNEVFFCPALSLTGCPTLSYLLF